MEWNRKYYHHFVSLFLFLPIQGINIRTSETVVGLYSRKKILETNTEKPLNINSVLSTI